MTAPSQNSDDDRRTWGKSPEAARAKADVNIDFLKVERELMDTVDKLEAFVLDHYQVNQEAAAARNAWNRHLMTTTTMLSIDGSKPTEARAKAAAYARRNDQGVLGADLHDAAHLFEAREKTISLGISAYRTTASAKQSLLNHMRAVTGLS